MSQTVWFNWDLPYSKLVFCLIEYFLLVDYIKGMKYGIKACCGYGGRSYNFNQKLFCGTTKIIGNSSATAKACRDPKNYVSWDGIHATEAANRRISTAILDGSISYPPFALNHLCPSV